MPSILNSNVMRRCVRPGDFARALVFKNGRGTEAKVARDRPDLKVDLAGWHMELVANKLQGTEFFRQRLVVTQDVIAMGSAASHRTNDTSWDDIIPLEEVGQP